MLSETPEVSLILWARPVEIQLVFVNDQLANLFPNLNVRPRVDESAVAPLGGWRGENFLSISHEREAVFRKPLNLNPADGCPIEHGIRPLFPLKKRRQRIHLAGKGEAIPGA